MADEPRGETAAPAGRDPLRAGLFPSLRSAAFQVDEEKWRAASAAGELVGQCRAEGCDGYLVADDDPPIPGVPRSYTARCLACEREMVAPMGRVLHRSGRHGESPKFYARRADMLKRTSGG